MEMRILESLISAFLLLLKVALKMVKMVNFKLVVVLKFTWHRRFSEVRNIMVKKWTYSLQLASYLTWLWPGRLLKKLSILTRTTNVFTKMTKKHSGTE
jgi:hypothetical protein